MHFMHRRAFVPAPHVDTFHNRVNVCALCMIGACNAATCANRLIRLHRIKTPYCPNRSLTTTLGTRFLK